jgi:HK97 family phage portal protein
MTEALPNVWMQPGVSARRISTEQRSAPPSTWDMMRVGHIEFGNDAGVPVTAYLAEGLAAVTACATAISETAGMLPIHLYRKLPDGSRICEHNHPLAMLLADGPNDWQTTPEFIEMMTAHCVLRGNSYAGIQRDNRGAIVALYPFHPDLVSPVWIPSTGRYAYDVSLRQGGTRRYLAEELLHFKDRSDDGFIGKSRLHRARESFGGAIATERYANSTFKNGAAMSGILSHPEAIGEAAATRLGKDFKQTYSGSANAGAVAVLEEGLKWQQISVSPDDAQMLQSRKFTALQIARIYRVPPPIIGDLDGAKGNSIAEIGRWFYSQTMMPWLNKWEKLIVRSLLSTAERRNFEVEFDCDLLLRGDMLTRFQAYRIAREVGIYNANELRQFEKANPRKDPGGAEYFAPANMNQEQTGQPIADRGGGDAAAQ